MFNIELIINLATVAVGSSIISKIVLDKFKLEDTLFGFTIPYRREVNAVWTSVATGGISYAFTSTFAPEYATMPNIGWIVLFSIIGAELV